MATTRDPLGPLTVVRDASAGTVQAIVNKESNVVVGPDARYTAAQLSALAAAGGLTPWATYVASDTGRRGSASSASNIVWDLLSTGKPTICFIGDSLTQYNLGQLGIACGTLANNTTGGLFNPLWAEWTTPSGAGGAGAGQVSYVGTATAGNFYWTAAGDTIGAAVPWRGPGLYKLPSGTAGAALYAGIVASATRTTGTIDLPIIASTQSWSGNSRGFGLAALANCNQQFRLAPAATSLGMSPGMDGFFGLGGCVASDLASATWELSQMPADIDVYQCGTNDFSGSVTVAQYVASVQSLANYRLNMGTSLFIWTTILPRDGESATSRKNKQAAALAIRDWAATTSGRVIVWDLASTVVDPSTGNYATGMSPDTVHLTPKGALTVGMALGPFLQGIAKANTQTLPATYGDVYDATYNPAGNLIGVLGPGIPMMAGTGGTAGAGASGVLAAGWTFARVSGAIAAVGSKVARTDTPGEWQQLVLSAATGNERFSSRVTTNITTGVTVGGEYAAEVEVRVLSSTGLNYIDLLILPNGVTARTCSAINGSGAETYPDFSTPQTLWLKTRPGWLVPTGTTSLNIYVYFGTSVGGTATVQIGRVKLYRVA